MPILAEDKVLQRGPKSGGEREREASGHLLVPLQQLCSVHDAPGRIPIDPRARALAQLEDPGVHLRGLREQAEECSVAVPRLGEVQALHFLPGVAVGSAPDPLLEKEKFRVAQLE